jgi:vacuolar protein sorting-associated protein 45
LFFLNQSSSFYGVFFFFFQEFFADYYPLNGFTLTLNLGPVISPKQANWENTLIRTSEGIVSFMLSLRKQPRIRYSGKSEVVQQVIRELDRRFSSERKAGLFHFESKGEPPLMLILDRFVFPFFSFHAFVALFFTLLIFFLGSYRRDDPVTPLLAQWNYAAMIHEFLEIKNNRVTYKKNPSEIKEDESDTEVSLSFIYLFSLFETQNVGSCFNCFTRCFFQ